MSTQTISPPQQIQNHGALGMALITLVTLGFLAANGYHGATALYWKYYNPATDNWVQSSMAGFVGLLISFFEMFIAVLLIKSVRLKDNWLMTMIWTVVFAMTVLMATQLGTMSQGGTQEQKQNAIQSNQAQTTSLQYKKDSALARKNQLYTHASTCTNCNPDAIRQAADRQYSNKMATLNQQEANLIKKRPITQNTGFESTIDKQDLNLLLALFCSIGGACMVVYKQLYHQSYMRTVEVSLRNKENMDWEVDKSNFKSETMAVNPLKGLSTFGFLGKVNPKQITPIPTAPKKKKASKDQGEKPWLMAALGDEPRLIVCDECDAELNIYPDELISATEHKGMLKCGNCKKPTNVITPKNKHTSDPEPTTANSQGLTTDSPELTDYIQQHSETGNPRKSSEIAGNPPEIQIGKQGNRPPAQPKTIKNQAATITQKDADQYEQHFAEVAKIKDQEAKLEALGSVIDKLAADPEHHGASFSSSAIRKQIGGRYDKVKAVFQQKKDEGKLAQNSDRAPYTIVYDQVVRHQNLDQVQVPGTHV